MTYTAIRACRICGSAELEPLLDLGEQALTGVFPSSSQVAQTLTKGPLRLVKCTGAKACGLVQLDGDYTLSEMYGQNYGYRSGLNRSMVKHLTDKVAWLQTQRPVGAGDVVVDIGSNDGTTLGVYPRGPTLVGMDPTIAKFGHHYRDDIQKHADFFNADSYRGVVGAKNAKIVTSISMFYDLPAPQTFVNDVAAILADDGIWHFEQSYLPTMLSTHSYDTVCHEHLEYYGLAQVCFMLERAGLRIVDVTLNDVNGGSFAVTAAKGTGPHAPIVAEMLREEETSLAPAAWAAFRSFVESHRKELPKMLKKMRNEGARVMGLGASTKGNVVLQYCGIDASLLSAVAEVNVEKYGCFTPGTHIPIISEEDAAKKRPDAYLVLPWHFRSTFMNTKREFLDGGGALLFPLPAIELVRA